MASQIVLISGCSTGMGLATAVFLAKDAEKRFKVYATMRSLAKKGQLEEEGKDCLGDTLIIKQMDVCSDESVEKAVKELLDAEGRIDVLFNNAGISVLTPLECVPMKTATEIFNVNYFGALRLIQAVLPGMKARQSGLIINNSSHFGIVGTPFMEVYCSSKFALEGLTESLAPILRQFNIRCCLLEPGPVQTPIFQKASDWTQENMDATTIDPKTKSLFEAALANFDRAISDVMQGSEEVAQIVKDVILGEKKDLRCQTNKKYAPEDIPAKLADPTGNKSVDIITERFLGGSNKNIL